MPNTIQPWRNTIDTSNNMDELLKCNAEWKKSDTKGGCMCVCVCVSVCVCVWFYLEKNFLKGQIRLQWQKPDQWLPGVICRGEYLLQRGLGELLGVMEMS